MAEAASPNFLSQADFAKRRKVSRKAVTVWKHKGLLVLSADGKVDVEQTEWSLDQRPATYRGGVTHRPVRAVGNDRVEPKVTKEKPTASRPSEPPAAARDDAGPADYLTSIELGMAEAVRRKENALGLRRVHELEIARQEWVRVEDVGLEVERDYATIRERFLTMPGKMASALAGMTRAQIETALKAEVTEILNELHDPAELVERVISEGSPQLGKESPSPATEH